jgi:hypothetical protein
MQAGVDADMAEEEMVPRVGEWLLLVVGDYQSRRRADGPGPLAWLSAHMRSRYGPLLLGEPAASPSALLMAWDGSVMAHGVTFGIMEDRARLEKAGRVGQLLAELPDGVGDLMLINYVEEVLELVAGVLAGAQQPPANVADTLLRIVSTMFLSH